MNKTFDSIIIGGGVSGLTAAIYLLRNKKSVLIIEKETIGGQISNSPRVENFPTINAISGPELSDRMFEQVSSLGAEFDMDEVINVKKENNLFYVKTKYVVSKISKLFIVLYVWFKAIIIKVLVIYHIIPLFLLFLALVFFRFHSNQNHRVFYRFY